jgi:glutathione S-transferase
LSTTPARFITIPLSHYCEKARWGLDRVALPYREEPHIPLLSRLATRRSDGGTVPLLVDGDVRLTDSTDILVHLDSARGGDLLYPRDAYLRREVDALEDRFDKDLGTHVRRWAYSHLLPEKALLRQLWARGAPRHETMWLPLIVPLGRKLLRKAYKVSRAGAARSRERVREIFGEVGERLKDGRRFLVGDRFTAADLTFASLAAPLVFPAECRATMPTLEQAPLAMRAEVQGFRATSAGEFALRLYAQERTVSR